MELQKLDPESYATIDIANGQRVVRALEVCLMTGRPFSSFKTAARKTRDFEIEKIGLTRPRDVLYDRINRRVDIMLEQGLEAEVRRLLDEGVPTDCQSMKSIGYRQMLWYLVDGMEYDFAVDKLKQATRNFAKRQVTFFKRMPYIEWYELDAEPDYENVVNSMEQTLVEKFKLV